MATPINAATRRAVRTAAEMGQPAKGANFESKSHRKARRKGLIRKLKRGDFTLASMANTLADRRIKFYRDLRHKKIRRRRIAAEVQDLSEITQQLHRELLRLGDRVPGLDKGLHVEAVLMMKSARASLETAAEEWYGFSRRRIEYGKVSK
jgi:hypothetical protein